MGKKKKEDGYDCSCYCWLMNILMGILLVVFFDRNNWNPLPTYTVKGPELARPLSYIPHNCTPVESRDHHNFQIDALIQLATENGYDMLTSYHIQETHCYFVTNVIGTGWTVVINPRLVQSQTHMRVFHQDPLCRHSIHRKYPQVAVFEAQLNYSIVNSTVRCKTLTCSKAMIHGLDMISGNFECPRS
jgi:hypothetical protein